MKQFLILLAFVGLVFAQTKDKKIIGIQEILPIQGVLEITDEMLEKINEARAKHRELIKTIRVMSPKEKLAYFEKLRTEAKTQMDAKLEELSPELKARIEAKMAEIKTNFEKKENKIEEFKTNIDAKNEAGTGKGEIKTIIGELKSRWRVKKEKVKKNK